MQWVKEFPMKKKMFKWILTILVFLEIGVAGLLLYQYYYGYENPTISKLSELIYGSTEREIATYQVEETIVPLLEDEKVDDFVEIRPVQESIESIESVIEEVVTTAELDDNQIQDLILTQQGFYAFDNMDQSLHYLYGEILYILTHLQQDVLLSSVDKSDIEYAFQCVLIDHPEIYYVDGYTYTTYSQDDEIVKIHFSGNYTKTKEEILTLNQQLEAAVMNCISGIAREADDYLKVKYCYEYLANHTVYNLEAVENQNLLSVLLYGESVCQGYAKAMQYLLWRMGVFNTLVVGTVDGGVGHAWNMVRMNGNYYYVDSTWGDAYYVFDQSQESEDSRSLDSINYDYLGVTTDMLKKTHTIDNPVVLPYCVATDDNYYVREGAYFLSYDTNQLAVIFQRAYEQGKNLVTLKCQNADVFQQMFQGLIVNQEVFGYLQNNSNSVAYTESEEQLSFTFFLNQ